MAKTHNRYPPQVSRGAPVITVTQRSKRMKQSPNPPDLAGHCARAKGRSGQSRTSNVMFQSRKDQKHFPSGLVDLGGCTATSNH